MGRGLAYGLGPYSVRRVPLPALTKLLCPQCSTVFPAGGAVGFVAGCPSCSHTFSVEYHRCTVCKAYIEKDWRLGTCNTCYCKWRWHGTLTPPPKPPSICKICQGEIPKGEMHRGRCQRCFTYFSKHGVERPDLDRLYVEARCSVCGVARAQTRRGHLPRGMCSRCYGRWYIRTSQAG
jgi:hypothetical protein